MGVSKNKIRVLRLGRWVTVQEEARGLISSPVGEAWRLVSIAPILRRRGRRSPEAHCSVNLTELMSFNLNTKVKRNRGRYLRFISGHTQVQQVYMDTHILPRLKRVCSGAGGECDRNIWFFLKSGVCYILANISTTFHSQALCSHSEPQICPSLIRAQHQPAH